MLNLESKHENSLDSIEDKRKIGKEDDNITSIEFHENIFHKISGTFILSKGCDF